MVAGVFASSYSSSIIANLYFTLDEDTRLYGQIHARWQKWPLGKSLGKCCYFYGLLVKSKYSCAECVVWVRRSRKGVHLGSVSISIIFVCIFVPSYCSKYYAYVSLIEKFKIKK